MHPQVVAFGLLSALLAGVADFLAALVSRKLGTFWTLLYMLASSAAVLVAVQLLGGDDQHLTWQDTLLTFGIAAAALAGYLAFYRGLAVGPVAVVSPIAACDGAVAALIGVALIGEALSPIHGVAVALLVAGVALAATDLRQFRQGLAAPGKGPMLALVPMIGFGIAIAGIGYLAERYQSFLLPILVLRCCLFLQLAAAAGVRRPSLPAVGLGLTVAAVAIGLLDTGSLLALAQGMIAEDGARVSLLGPLYGAYPVVTVLLALVLLKEKLVANQWVGVGCVFFGTALMVAIK
jgi:drug/metabolite transporter (DMT)-like permease